jgi:hypothetical protein
MLALWFRCLQDVTAALATCCMMQRCTHGRHEAGATWAAIGVYQSCCLELSSPTMSTCCQKQAVQPCMQLYAQAAYASPSWEGAWRCSCACPLSTAAGSSLLIAVALIAATQPALAASVLCYCPGTDSTLGLCGFHSAGTPLAGQGASDG